MSVSFDGAAALTAFLVVFPVELPDKTFVASLVLATRYRPLSVWLGVAAAFFLQCALAVVAGELVTLLPRRAVAALAAALFAGGAVLLLRGAGDRAALERERREEEAEVAREARPATGARAVLTSFGVLFAAEWGDLSQLLTVGLVARFQSPLSVFVGSWLSLVTVAALAVLVGKTLVRYIAVSTIRRVSGSVCILLATVSALEAAGVDLPW